MPTSPSSETASETSARTFAASVLPSMAVADTDRGYSLRSMRLPRKNDAASIAARREALGLDGDVDLSAYTNAAESVTGVAVIPVSVAQLHIALGEYELSAEGE